MDKEGEETTYSDENLREWSVFRLCLAQELRCTSNLIPVRFLSFSPFENMKYEHKKEIVDNYSKAIPEQRYCRDDR